MADELNIITTDANAVNVTTEDRTITITNDGDATTVTLSAAETTTVQIATIGPKGDKGDVGNIDVSTLATTGSNTFRGNQTVTGSINITDGITGSLLGTASFATTASYALNAGAGAGFPFSGSAVITGSLLVTEGITGSFSGSVFGYVPNEATTSFVTNSQTSSFLLNSQTGSMLAAYVLNSQTSSFVTNAQTNSFVTNSQTSSFVLNSQTGSFITNSQTSSFVTNSQTSSFVTNQQTSSFVTNAQTSSFVLNTQTGSMLSPYTLNSQTSSFVRNTQTGSFVTNSQTASFATTGSNTFRGNQIISGSITQTASTASFGGKVGIGVTNPTYTLDVSGSTRINSNTYQPGDVISSYLKVAYVYTGSELNYNSSYQQVLTCTTASIPKLSWASSSNNPNTNIGTNDGIGYAPGNWESIASAYSAPAANTQFFFGFNNYLTANVSGYYTQTGVWYVPTKAELQKVYDNRVVIGIVETEKIWSSTEVSGSGTTAWALNFNTGEWSAELKTAQYRIIPVSYYNVNHLPAVLQFDNVGLRLKNIGAASATYNLQYDTTTGDVTYYNNPTVPGFATTGEINSGSTSQKIVSPTVLEESKFTTINIFNHINFT